MALTPREARQSDASLLNVTADLGATDTAALAKLANILAGTYGTAVNKSWAVGSSTTTDVYTVTTGKTLYIYRITGASAIATGTGTSEIRIVNAGNETQFIIMETYVPASNVGVPYSINNVFPIAVSAALKFQISNGPNVINRGGFHGFEI